MRDRFPLFIVFLAGYLASIGCAVAEEQNEIKFQFAPAPVTNPVAANEKQRRLSLHYLSYSGAIDLQGYGFTTTERHGHESGKTGTSMAQAFTFLTGAGEIEESTISTSMDLTGFTYDTASSFEWFLGENGIFSLGFKFDTSYFSVQSSSTSGFGTFDSESAVLNLYFGAQPGLQYHFNLTPQVTVTPYVLYSYAYILTSVSSGDYSDSFSSETSSTVFGLDINLFRKFSVASMFQRAKDDDLIFINLGWNY